MKLLKEKVMNIPDRLVVIVLIVVIGVSAFFVGRLSANPSPTLSTVIEPGSMVAEASYIIFKDGSTVYARNGTTGEIENYSGDAATVIQWAINKIPLYGWGRIFIKNAKEPYDIYRTILIENRAVIIDSDWATLTLKDDGDMFIFWRAFRTYEKVWSELNHIVIDHNQQDGAAITIADTWYAKIRCSIRNVKHMGVWLISNDHLWGTYYNELDVDIRGVGWNQGGFGIIMQDNLTADGSTNFNRISGTAHEIEDAVYIGENCKENIIEHFDASNNTIAYNIWGKRTKLINVYQEGSSDYGILLRPGSSAVIIPGNMVSITLEGNAEATVINETGMTVLNETGEFHFPP